jgi:cytidine deaminase
MTPGTREILISKAVSACENAYAPYSKFQVGAAILTEEGNFYEGCNVENASYGLTICAERNAIFQAVSVEGKKMKIKALALKTPDALSFKEELTTPCGACRQVIVEFGDNIPIFHYAKGEWQETSINTLLPKSFNGL